MKCENNRKEFVENFLLRRILGNLCLEREVNENVDKNNKEIHLTFRFLRTLYEWKERDARRKINNHKNLFRKSSEKKTYESGLTKLLDGTSNTICMNRAMKLWWFESVDKLVQLQNLMISNKELFEGITISS
jgi:hypothetical protein